MPMPTFDVIYQSQINVIFCILSCANACVQRNCRDDMKAAANCPMPAFNISKVCKVIHVALTHCGIHMT